MASHCVVPSCVSIASSHCCPQDPPPYPSMGRVHAQKNFTSLSARCWAGESSYRQGSVLAWSQPWTWMNWRMTICQHRQNKTTAMMDVLNVLLLLRLLFYNPLIINSVCCVCFCRYFYRNSALTCARTSLFLAIYFYKNLYTALGVSTVSTVHSPKMKDCY